jgi:hypothetical protein
MIKTRDTTTSRRALLAGAPAAAAITLGSAILANGFATAIAGTAEVDPIYAAMAAHSEAIAHEMACHKASSALQQTTPDDRQTWHLIVGYSETPPAGCADAPDWVASQLAILAAYNRRDEAIEALAATTPTTLAGALDFLDYLGSPEFSGAGESIIVSISSDRLMS